MSKIFRNIIIFLPLFLSISLKTFSDTSGCISGALLLDETWERTVYVSLIEPIEKEYSVSNDMIVANSKIDSIGKFAVKLNNLPSEWCLLRLHVVKKGVSPASLVIGS